MKRGTYRLQYLLECKSVTWTGTRAMGKCEREGGEMGPVSPEATTGLALSRRQAFLEKLVQSRGGRRRCSPLLFLVDSLQDLSS